MVVNQVPRGGSSLKLEIIGYKIVKIINDRGVELEPINLRIEQYQKKSRYWDRYNSIKTLLYSHGVIEDSESDELTLVYHNHHLFDILIEEKNKTSDIPQEKGTFTFDLDTDYETLVKISKDHYVDPNLYVDELHRVR